MKISKSDSIHSQNETNPDQEGNNDGTQSAEMTTSKPVAGNIAESENDQNPAITEADGQDGAVNTDETAKQASSQVKQPEPTKGSMDFANRYK